MTFDDFQNWLEDYCEAFSETAAWVNQYGPTVTKRWKEAFDEKRVTLSEAKQITKAMLCGDIEPVPAYDRSSTPAYIIRAVREYRTVNKPQNYFSEAENYEQIKAARQKGDSFPAGKIFRAVRAKMDAGADADAACREVFKQFPTPPDNDTFYTCNLCGDNSLRVVSVVNARTPKEFYEIAHGTRPLTTAVAACTCRDGRQMNSTRQTKLIEFDPQTHVMANGSKELIRELILQFIASYGQKRVAAFDDFNSRNF